MRILYAGTPEIAVPSFERLADDFTVCGVLTNPDRQKGRGRKNFPPPIKTAAEKRGIPVLQFESPGKEAREAVRLLSPDVLVVFAYGKIFGKKFLSLFNDGCFNIHPSLLPRYRGSSPLLSAILAGDSETGITVQKMALKMDSGDIVKQISYPLSGEETTAFLRQWAAVRSAPLIRETISDLEKGTLHSYPQNEEEATYCRKITKDDGLIDWSEAAEVLDRKIRAFNPWPGSFTFLGNKKLNIITATYKSSHRDTDEQPGKVLGVDKNHGILIQTGSGVLVVTSLQLQSKKVLDWKTFLNGTPQIIGTLVGGSR